MAKVRGPLHSLDARGNWGLGALQFRGGNGGLHAYRPAPPGSVNQAPPTAAQAAIRAQYREALESWRGLDDLERAHWDAQGAAREITGWNLYLKTWMETRVIPPDALLTQDETPLLTHDGAFIRAVPHWMESQTVPADALLTQDATPLLTLHGFFIRAR